MPASEPIAVLFKERVISFETMHLGFMAEKILPLTMAPTLVDLTKAVSTDKVAFSRLSVSSTITSCRTRICLPYKMTHERLFFFK